MIKYDMKKISFQFQDHVLIVQIFDLINYNTYPCNKYLNK